MESLGAVSSMFHLNMSSSMGRIDIPATGFASISPYSCDLVSLARHTDTCGGYDHTRVIRFAAWAIVAGAEELKSKGGREDCGLIVLSVV